MLSQRLHSEFDYNELINSDDFTAATELTSIHVDSETENSTGSSPPTVAPIYLTHTTAKLEQLLKDIPVAETLLEKNISLNIPMWHRSILSLVMGGMGGIGIFGIWKGVEQNDLAGTIVFTGLLAGTLSGLAAYICVERGYGIDQEQNRKNGIFDDSRERLKRQLTANEVTQIQSTAMAAGIDNSYIDSLDSGDAMRKASAAFIRQRERILKAVHRNHRVEAVLNELSMPTVLSALILDYCSNPTLAR